MAIYQECSTCHTRQGRKNKKCRKCSSNLTKDRKKVYYVGFRPIKGGQEKLERIGTNLEEAKNREAEILQMRLSGYEIEKNKNAVVTLEILLKPNVGNCEGKKSGKCCKST